VLSHRPKADSRWTSVPDLTASVPQDLDELFDVVDERGRPTGVVKRRADVHRDGDWHRAVHVWIIGLEGDEPFILFQRRSSGKDTWPDKLSVTVGGHLGAGETVTDAMREIEEELGIAPNLTGLQHIGTRVAVGERGPDWIDRELLEVFLLRDDRPLNAYAPAAAEVAALARFPLDPLLALFAGQRESGPATLLDAATGAIFPADLPLADFIPVTDEYFARAARAARAALRGDHAVGLEPLPFGR
jgi:isopentenyldiphosphate isomerase